MASARVEARSLGFDDAFRSPSRTLSAAVPILNNSFTFDGEMADPTIVERAWRLIAHRLAIPASLTDQD